MNTYKVYLVDTWAGDEAGTWDKNDWLLVGEINFEVGEGKRAILQKLLIAGFMRGIKGVQVHNHDCEGKLYEIVTSHNQFPILDIRKVQE